MKCEKVINDFLNQDDSRYPAFLIRLHIAFCSRCRKEVSILQKIFVYARTSSSFKMPDDLSNPIMRRIFKSDVIYEKNISSSKWLLSGIVIFLSIFLVSYSDSFIWLRSHFGSLLEIPLYIVMGFIITLYAAMYIGTHIDDMRKFVKFIENRINL
ncbi:MAG: hypothetical protein JXN64_04385 [Spirochaetes bacterium]|nr:hypothetical protein [Spirochaetota bacterium]